MKLPADDYILLSLVNTALRDKFDTFGELCEDWEADENALCARLAALGYEYDPDKNAFLPV